MLHGNNGCWSRDNVQASAPRAKTLVPKAASTLAVCFFGKRQVLLASTRFEGTAAAQLVELLHDTKPGRNPALMRPLQIGYRYQPLPKE